MTTTWEVAYQSLMAFFVLFVLARILGKRQIANLTFFDYIAGITIGDIAGAWSMDEIKTRHALVILVIWTLLTLVLAAIQRKSYTGRLILDGRPIVVIENGQVLERNLRKANLDIEELMLLLREKDVFKLSDVEYAVFENNGKLSVMKKSELQPATPKDLRVPVVSEHEAKLVIIDGHVMEKSLKDTGFTKEWLLGEIRKQGANDFKDVFLGQVDSNGNVYVDLYLDTLKVPEVKKKALVAASLKKAQSDLEMFAHQTENERAKHSYAQMAAKLHNVLNEVLPFLKD
jgi:uncharacterized membrane protein YcaP (DUF421 family)